MSTPAATVLFGVDNPPLPWKENPMSSSLAKKEYLGDGVYADFDGFSLVLTTENGIETTNTIVLEPEVYVALTNYAARVRTPPSPPGSAGGMPPR